MSFTVIQEKRSVLYPTTRGCVYVCTRGHMIRQEGKVSEISMKLSASVTILFVIPRMDSFAFKGAANTTTAATEERENTGNKLGGRRRESNVVGGLEC